MAFSLDTKEPEQTVSLAADQSSAAPSESTAAKRAYKLQVTDSLPNMTHEEMYNHLLSGREEMLRQAAATQADLKASLARTQGVIGAAARDPNWQPNTMPPKPFPADPKSVIEENYAQKYINGFQQAAARNAGTVSEEVHQSDPDYAQQAKEAGMTAVAKREYAIKLLEDQQDAIQHQDWWRWGYETAKEFIPLHSLIYKGMYDRNREILNLPFDQYKQQVDANVKSLGTTGNHQLVKSYLEDLAGKSSDSQVLDHIGELTDLTIVGSPLLKLGVKGVRGAQAINEFRQAVKSAIATSADDPVGNAAIPNAVGDLGNAATEKVATKLNADLAGTTDPIHAAKESLPSFFDLAKKKIVDNPGRYGQALANQINERIDAFRGQFMNIIENIAKVERISPFQAATKAIDLWKNTIIKKDYTGIENSLLNFSDPFPDPSGISNSYHYYIDFGRENGELFFNKRQAEIFAAQNGFGKIGPTVQIVNGEGVMLGQQGMGYFLRVVKPVDETHNVIRNSLIKTNLNKSPTSFWRDLHNPYTSGLRTADETLAELQNRQRKVATYAPAALQQAAVENNRIIKEAAQGRIRVDPVTGEAYPSWVRKYNYADRKRNKLEWDEAVNAGKDMIDPATGEKGYFFQSPGELETFWQQKFQRLPSWEETEAYFAMVRNSELDLFLRRKRMYDNKIRLGAEDHTFYMVDAQGKRIYAPTFEGVKKARLPFGDDTAVVVGDTPETSRIYHPKVKSLIMDSATRRDVEQKIEQGIYKVIEIGNPEYYPLAGLGENFQGRIRYVVAKNTSAEPLNWEKQVPRRGGGHLELDYDHYVKQADVVHDKDTGRFWYNGDKTIMPVAIRAMGTDVAKKLDQIRIYMKDGNIEAAKSFAAANLPQKWEDIEGWFKPTIGPGGERLPPHINMTEPIQVVGKNETIIGRDKNAIENRYAENTFKDGTTQGSLFKNYQVPFTGKRDAQDLFTLDNEGTVRNPLYKIAPVKYVSAIPSMNRALNGIINSTFMDDYKIQAMETWLQEAKDLMQPKNSDIYSSPFFHFYKPQWKPDADPNVVKSLMANWYKIRALVGMQSDLGGQLHASVQKIVDSIYEKGFQRTAAVAGWLLPEAGTPVTKLRSMAYHTSIGLFSWPQLFVQSMTWSNIYGIAGAKYANAGAMATMLHQFSRIYGGEEFIDHLDSIAAKMHIPGMSNWRPGEFKESLKFLNDTGFAQSTGTGAHIFLDNPMSHKTIQSTWGEFLDLGTIFFKGADRNARMGAGHTAFREWRDANPTGKITDSVKAQILNRADVLNNNMSRASASMLNQGVLSVPFQFYGYTLRLAELMTGKRLTPIEKARLLFTNAAWFGIPAAAGMGGFPFGDLMKKSAQENGYNVGDNFIEDLWHQGIPSMLINLITGGGYDFRAGKFLAGNQKGWWLNFGDRYGSPGLQTIRDALRGDKTMWQIAGGAAFGKLGNMLAAMDPFWKAMIHGLQGDGQYKLKAEDILQPLEQVGSISNTARALMALHSGNWMTTTGKVLDTDVSTRQAIAMAISGLSPEQASTMSNQNWTQRDETALQKSGLAKFRLNMSKYYRALADKDNEQAMDYWKRARADLIDTGYPTHKLDQAYRIAAQDNRSMIANTDWNWATKDVPGPTLGIFGWSNDPRQMRQDAWRRRELQRRNK